MENSDSIIMYSWFCHLPFRHWNSSWTAVLKMRGLLKSTEAGKWRLKALLDSDEKAAASVLHMTVATNKRYPPAGTETADTFAPVTLRYRFPGSQPKVVKAVLFG
jgi:hypothetical protein